MSSIGARTRIAVAALSATTATEVGIISNCRGATGFLVKLFGSGGTEVLGPLVSFITPNWTGIAHNPTTAVAVPSSMRVKAQVWGQMDGAEAQGGMAYLSPTVAGSDFAAWPTRYASLFVAFASAPGGARTFTIDVWPIFTIPLGNAGTSFLAGDMPDATGR